MWLPGQRVGAVAGVDRRGDRARARTSLPLHARGLPECAAQGRDGARRLVAGAGRRRGGDVPDGDGAARRGRATSSTRSRTSRGPDAASRHNLKYWTDGEWLGFGCGAHSTRGRRPLEERRGHRGIRRARAGGPADGDRSAATAARRTAWRCAVHRASIVTEALISQKSTVATALTSGSATRPTSNHSSTRAAWSGRARPLRLTRRGMLLAHEVMSVFV